MRKKLSLLGLMIISPSAFAVTSGFYLGMQLGQTNLNNPPYYIQSSTSSQLFLVTPSNTGFGTRFFAGAQGNQYYGGEFGITYFTPSQYSLSGASSSNNTPQIYTAAFDLMGKAIYPIYAGFAVYGKLGLAFAYVKASSGMDNTPGNENISNGIRVRPAFAAGASYDISQNWVADISYNRITSGSGFASQNSMNNANFVALGISYHFTSQYCGQFLC
jgi:opacity protein-like surface antigen